MMATFLTTGETEAVWSIVVATVIVVAAVVATVSVAVVVDES